MDEVARKHLSKRLDRQPNEIESWVKDVTFRAKDQGLWWLVDAELASMIREYRDMLLGADTELLNTYRGGMIALRDLLDRLRQLVADEDEAEPAVEEFTMDLINVEERDYASR